MVYNRGNTKCECGHGKHRHPFGGVCIACFIAGVSNACTKFIPKHKQPTIEAVK